MAPATAALFPLLELPDPCMLAVMQCCAAAGDLRSLFSAARTHSKLQEAAVAALHSITAHVTQQQQADSLLLYLERHAQHVDEVSVEGADDRPVPLRQLPPNLQPHSLSLDNFCLQLQPGNGYQGVLGAAATVAALKQLQLGNSQLLDGEDGLAATMQQLPSGLEALGVAYVGTVSDEDDEDPLLLQPIFFPSGVLQRLQQLTRLELAGIKLRVSDLLALQPLTLLVELVLVAPTAARDSIDNSISIAANMLSGMQHLTCLELASARDILEGWDPTVLKVESGVLAGKTKLRELTLQNCSVPGGAAGAAQLLSHLQPMQQLRKLDLNGSMRYSEEGNPPATAYAALTANSQWQHVNISGNVLPAGEWQQLFPAGRRLPHLTALEVSGVCEVSGAIAAAPEGNRLVTCCPGLQSLDLRYLCRNVVELLGSLQGLSGLHTLRCSVAVAGPTAARGLEALCQLTGLRELHVSVAHMSGKLVQLTRLQQLTALSLESAGAQEVFRCQAPGDEPVWRQLGKHYINHSDRAVARQAAATLVV